MARAALVLAVLGGAALAACGPLPEMPAQLQIHPEPHGERARVEPSYIFALGAHRADVEAMLGMPEQPARYDNLTRSWEVDYLYPFPAIQAETQFANGVTRSEMVDHIAMFFDSKGILTRMASRTNRWYPSVIEQQVQRITVLPRLVHGNGTITGVRAAPP